LSSLQVFSDIDFAELLEFQTAAPIIPDILDADGLSLAERFDLEQPDHVEATPSPALKSPIAVDDPQPAAASGIDSPSR
jgi:hypothetical protein